MPAEREHTLMPKTKDEIATHISDERNLPLIRGAARIFRRRPTGMTDAALLRHHARLNKFLVGIIFGQRIFRTRYGTTLNALCAYKQQQPTNSEKVRKIGAALRNGGVNLAFAARIAIDTLESKITNERRSEERRVGKECVST